MFKKIQSLLSGKKTYVVGLLMIALGYATGDNTLVLEGLGLISLRAGVAKK